MSMFWCKYPMTNFMLRKRYFQSLIDVSNTVQEALFTKKPVVALETAVISHGMPYPYNKEVAIAVEEIVKQQGAVPATIGVVNGRIKVGMNAEIISLLARPETKKVKISRRDVPVVLSQGLTGGTTVSGTLLVAKMIGINVFVTGGIGGVHRDVTDSMDVSADLIELSNSPVLAVCSGVKSILDISRTLEYLETFGVCVVTYGETKEFPAFYSQKSGSQCVYNVTNPEAAADLIFNSRKLNLNTAVVLGVPIPEEFAIDDKIMQTIIKEALVLSKERGIHGKYLTPFLLERINCITKGKSLESNIALIKNNAVIGGQIAVQLSEKSSKERLFAGNVRVSNCKTFQKEPSVIKSGHSNIVVIGGSIMDIVVHANKDIQFDGRTLNGIISTTAGGVARNIVDAIGKLQPNSYPYFISTMSDDAIGQFLWNSLEHVNRAGVSIIQNENSACSVVVLDQQRDCSFVIMNADIHRRIGPQQILVNENIIAESELVVFDANLSVETIETILQLCKKHNVKVWFEPTDLTVAMKPFQTQIKNSIDYVSPNLRELQYMVQFVRKTPVKQVSVNEDVNTVVKEARDLALEILDLIPNVIVTLGKHGLLTVKNVFDGPKVVFYKAEEQLIIENVSGVGDCLASGYIVAMLRGLPENECVLVGMNSALQSLCARQTVPSTLRYGQPLNEKSKRIELPVTGPIRI